MILHLAFPRLITTLVQTEAVSHKNINKGSWTPAAKLPAVRAALRATPAAAWAHSPGHYLGVDRAEYHSIPDGLGRPCSAQPDQLAAAALQVVADGLHILIGDPYNTPTVRVRRALSNDYEDVRPLSSVPDSDAPLSVLPYICHILPCRVNAGR